MHNTTTPAFALESIDPAALLFVSGGCHKHCCSCQPQQQQTVINMPQQAQPQQPSPLPQAAPQAQLPPSDPGQSGPSGDVVSTSVSINGRQVS